MLSEIGEPDGISSDAAGAAKRQPLDNASLKTLVNECISHASREGLRQFPQLRRWEMTGDVMQQATASLWQALREGKVQPGSPLHLQNLARLHVKWTLLTLARQHARSVRARQMTPGACHTPRHLQPVVDVVCDRTPADEQRDWMLFHAAVHELPDPQRQIFELAWYDDQSKTVIAEILQLNIRTVQREYRRACEALLAVLPKDFIGVRPARQESSRG